MVKSLAILMGGWFAMSIPVGVLVGRAFRLGGPAPAKERPRQLDRLATLELREIPGLRSALGAWVDDPHLARELHERREDARSCVWAASNTIRGTRSR